MLSRNEDITDKNGTDKGHQSSWTGHTMYSFTRRYFHPPARTTLFLKNEKNQRSTAFFAFFESVNKQQIKSERDSEFKCLFHAYPPFIHETRDSAKSDTGSRSFPLILCISPRTDFPQSGGKGGSHGKSDPPEIIEFSTFPVVFPRFYQHYIIISTDLTYGRQMEVICCMKAIRLRHSRFHQMTELS
jgi:hypothetical protein